MHFEAEYEHPEVVRTLSEIPENKLIELLGIEIEKSESAKKSRWAMLSEKIKSNPAPLGDYTDEDENVRREFRENFHFKQDA